jgi:hypothetical protein
MSDAERARRADKILEMFESALKTTGIVAAPDIRIKDRVDGDTSVVISIPDGRNVRFLVLTDGVILRVLSNGNYSIGIGSLDDELPANGPSLCERIARRIRNAFANEA